VARDGGDGEVVMMAAVAKCDGSRQQGQRWTTTLADEDGSG
jgi:hypothetical protein